MSARRDLTVITFKIHLTAYFPTALLERDHLFTWLGSSIDRASAPAIAMLCVRTHIKSGYFSVFF